MLKIPKEFIFDNSCKDLLVEHLKDYIVHYYKDDDLYKQGIDIYLHNDYLRTKYNHHIYNITIVKINGLYYYFLSPYKKSYLVLPITSPNVFIQVVNAIREHDLSSKEKAHQ